MTAGNYDTTDIICCRLQNLASKHPEDQQTHQNAFNASLICYCKLELYNADIQFPLSNLQDRMGKTLTLLIHAHFF